MKRKNEEEYEPNKKLTANNDITILNLKGIFYY